MTNQDKITNSPSLLGDALQALEASLDALRQAVREALNSAGSKPQSNRDRLLTADKAAEMLAVSPDWLYRNAKKLPFTRKLGPKMLRFSNQGIAKWLETRKFN